MSTEVEYETSQFTKEWSEIGHAAFFRDFCIVFTRKPTTTFSFQFSLRLENTMRYFKELA